MSAVPSPQVTPKADAVITVHLTQATTYVQTVNGSATYIRAPDIISRELAEHESLSVVVVVVFST